MKGDGEAPAYNKKKIRRAAPFGNKDGDKGRLENEVKDQTSQEDLKDLQEVEKDFVTHGGKGSPGFPG
jgi:hypothetical protein